MIPPPRATVERMESRPARYDLELVEVLGHGLRGPHWSGGVMRVAVSCACGRLVGTPRRPTEPDVVTALILEHAAHVVTAYAGRDLKAVVTAARHLIAGATDPAGELAAITALADVDASLIT